MNTTFANKADVDRAYEPTAAPPQPESRIRFEVNVDRIGILTFDRPDSAANIFDRQTLEELGEHLTAIELNPTLRGLVVGSAKKSIFIAGADLNAIADTDDAAKLSNLIKLGQDTFNRLAELPFPTVAAIHGACVGGGYEICLACDMRVATDDKGTKIGLPETQLGILPAWGGSTRLPRLIGLPGALDMIIAGKTVTAQKAHRIGMVDGVVPHEKLMETAHQWIMGGKYPPRGNRRPAHGKMTLFNNSLAGGLIERRVRPDLMRKTRGHYPATTKALEVLVNGLKTTEARAMELEHNAIME
ncbi:MAG: enoyl-CoA hydratase-related protein, partial [Limisphaerales bacterium]